MLFLSSKFNDENKVPEIKNVEWKVGKNNSLQIDYDLFDHENDSVLIVVKIYDKQNTPLDLNQYKITGDLGFPVLPSKKKSLTVDLPANITITKVTILAEDLYKLNISRIVDEVDTGRLRNTLRELSITRNYKTAPQNVSVVQHKVAAYFTKSGLQVSKQDIPYDNYTGHNIMGIKAGTRDSNMLLLGAHLDAVPNSHGADDNASGVAALMEIARVLSKYDLQKSVAFVAFDLEEEGLIGSKKFVGDNSFKNNLIGYLNFDMIGYTNKEPNSQSVPDGLDQLFPEAYKKLASNEFKGDFLLSVSNDRSDSLRILFSEASAQYVSALNIVSLLVPDDGKFAPRLFRGSDHASFWDGGIRALSIGDTGDVRNPNYHSEKDKVTTVDITFLSQVAKAALATVIKICSPSHSTSYTIQLSL
jgi:hypothetical protein